MDKVRHLYGLLEILLVFLSMKWPPNATADTFRQPLPPVQVAQVNKVQMIRQTSDVFL